MNKPFNIHDWQDKQKRSLFEQEELGPQSPKLDLIVDRILNVTGGRLATWQLKETIKSSHDMMLMQHLMLLKRKGIEIMINAFRQKKKTEKRSTC